MFKLGLRTCQRNPRSRRRPGGPNRPITWRRFRKGPFRESAHRKQRANRPRNHQRCGFRMVVQQSSSGFSGRVVGDVVCLNSRPPSSLRKKCISMVRVINEFKSLGGTFGQTFAPSSHCLFHPIGLTSAVKSQAARRSERCPGRMGTDAKGNGFFLRIRD